MGALGVVAPIGVAWLGGRLTHDLEPTTEDVTSAGRKFPWFAVALFCAGYVKCCVVGSLSTGFTPALHDEWSYLFGAQTLAAGRFANSPPPHPEFFDAFHILTTPRWVTRYWPGHPLALALGVLAGWPPGAVTGLCAGTAVWVYLLGKELGGDAVGKLAGLLTLLAPGLDFITSGYLSQSTFLCAITGCYVCTIRGIRRASVGWTTAAGALGGWAILTRPYSAAAMGFPLAVWFVWQSCRRFWQARDDADELGGRQEIANAPDRAGRGAAGDSHPARIGLLIVAAVLPVVACLGFLALYNSATTGSMTRTAWGEYNRQFEPANTLGFSTGVDRIIDSKLHPRKLLKAQSIAHEKLAFTPTDAARRALADPRRLSEMIFPAVGFYGLIAFVPFGRRRQTEARPSARVWWLIVFGITSHYVAYSFFYSTWGVYGHETIPLVIVLVAAGCLEFWRQARDSDRPGIAATVPLVLLAALVFDAREIGRFIERRQAETKVHRDFRKKLDGLQRTPAIVFVQVDSKRSREVDLINNSPDLDSRVLVVLDRGPENTKLLETIPGRAAYLFDEVNGSLTPWSPPKPDVPARSRDRQWPSIATSRRESKDP
jgi:hypothetical protein